MSRKSKSSAAPRTAWDVAEEVPRAGIPSTDALARRMRWNRRVIWLVLAAFPLMALSLFVTATSLKAANARGTGAVTVDTAGRSTAMSAVTDWLTGKPQPLPGGSLVSWDSSSVLPAYAPGPSDAKTDKAPPVLTEHSLTVRDASGSMFVVQVLVASDTLGQFSVVGSPSVLPVAPSSSWATGVSPWPNNPPATASDTVVTAVNAWSDAFASGDPAKLRVTVGDPNSDHAYMPLTGVVSAKAAVGAAAWRLDDQGKATSTMLVQVTVQFVWPGTDTKAAGAAPATYDLLVDGANSGAPRVVAWGGAGTGPVLVAYQNAVLGLQLEAAPVPVATQSAPAPSSAATQAGTN